MQNILTLGVLRIAFLLRIAAHTTAESIVTGLNNPYMLSQPATQQHVHCGNSV